MARYDITKINGITKVETDKGFIYHFPLEIIETFSETNAMKRTQRGQTDSEYIKFSMITNKLGAGNIEAYVDMLANGGYYLTSESISTLDIGTGKLLSNAEIESLVLLNSINNSMKELIFLIKAITE